ncbi:MAG: hypothetical protein BWX83_01107 [Candidatus Cloacimonetes bacterium ADurb.Bin117]|nr:MAG: hypothetical protein BWX83_01107 [Candidatus Cloacimonetes bacterium ADurb.Bin117]
MPLREGHGATVEPAVDHFLGAVHAAAAFRASELHVVDVRPVQFYVFGHRGAVFQFAALHQFTDGAHGALFAAVFADPDVQRRAPETVSGKGPVNVVGQPFAEAFFAHEARIPVDLAVLLQQLFLELGGADVPAFTGIVDEQVFAAPAVGIAVFNLFAAVEVAAFLQAADDVFVRGFHEDAGPGFDQMVEFAFGIHRLDERQVIFEAEGIVVRSESRGGVHYPGAVIHAHVICQTNIPSGFFWLDETEKRLIAAPFQLAAGKFAQNLVFAFQSFQPGFGQDVVFLQMANLHVSFVRMHNQRHIRNQRPRRGSPGQIPGAVFVQSLEFHEDRGILNVPVAQRHFVGRERRSTAWAVRHDLVRLVDQPAAEKVV